MDKFKHDSSINANFSRLSSGAVFRLSFGCCCLVYLGGENVFGKRHYFIIFKRRMIKISSRC
jgi:hypothetical protein